MRLFVTGAGGFIGSRVRSRAEARGHEVLCLERPYHMANLPLDKLAAFRPDACIHCAWITTPGAYQVSPANAHHASWSVTLIERLLELGTRGFVVLGSCAEYAASTTRLTENHPLAIDGPPYAQAKIGLHRTLQAMKDRLGFDLAWPRIFFPFGEGEHPQRLFSTVVRAVRQGEYDPTMIRHPDAVRDYVHVDDTAAAILLLAERAANGPFNVSTGRGVAIGAASELLARMLRGSPPDNSRSPDTVSHDMVVGDPARLLACGWRPQHNLESGLGDYLPHPSGANEKR